MSSPIEREQETGRRSATKRGTSVPVDQDEDKRARATTEPQTPPRAPGAAAAAAAASFLLAPDSAGSASTTTSSSSSSSASTTTSTTKLKLAGATCLGTNSRNECLFYLNVLNAFKPVVTSKSMTKGAQYAVIIVDKRLESIQAAHSSCP